MMALYDEHPQRKTLSDEVHARPPVPLRAPEVLTYLAFLHQGENATERERAHLLLLSEQLGLAPPDPASGHVLIDAGEFRLKWELHNEFSSYTFIRRIEPSDAADDGALRPVPAAWRKDIPGQLIVATHVSLRPAEPSAPQAILASYGPNDAPLIASAIAGTCGWVFTDFQIRDGFSRFLVLDDGLTPRQAGRTVQRLLEIETYRVLALLAFPVAKEIGQLLARAENELASLMDAMGSAADSRDEHAILGRMTRLAAEIERSVARTTFRFGAAAAYYRLVGQRIAELRESRLPGHPTLREFMERRLTPAIDTCATMARRQEDLSSRIARGSQLLRTRVDLELERQNQELLAQMNRRAKLQLRLQETVEELSVVAITYYGSQLVHYLAKGAKNLIAPLSPEGITAAAIPLIAAVVFAGLRRTRARLGAEEA